MNCKKCGSLLTENDQFCKNCGAAANETNAQNLNSVDLGNNIEIKQPNMPGGYMHQPHNQPNSVSNGNMMGNGMNQQPMNRPQPNMPGGYMHQPHNQPNTSNKGKSKFIIIGVIIAVLIVAAIIAIIVLKDGFNNSLNNGPVTDNNNNNNNSNTHVSKSFYKVDFKGFTFNIPDNLIYQKSDDFLMLANEEDTWGIQIEIEQGNYERIKENGSQLVSILKQQGMNVTMPSEKTYGGVNFLTMEASYAGENAIIGFARANAMYVVGITLASLNNEYDYSLFEEVAPIISTATYSNQTSNIELGINLDMEKLMDYAK